MPQPKHDVVARPVKEGEFIQLTGWFGDVWSYVTRVYGPSDGCTTQTVCHVRRDKRGEIHRRSLDTLDVLGTSIRHSPGCLMHGMDQNRLRRVATTEELIAIMAGGSGLIVQLPAFKLLHGQAWRGGEVVGRILPRSGDVELLDGTIVPFGSAASLATPDPLC
jgi:hypothetical protein